MVRLFCLLFPAALGAQEIHVPQSAWLEWRDLRVVISPDSGGTFFWVNTGTKRIGDPGKTFATTFNPALVQAWLGRAQRFLSQTPSADTVTAERSDILRGTENRGMYLARRKYRDEWTAERFIVMESIDGEPVIINGDDRSVREILDSLRVVAERTPYSAEVARRDSIDEAVHPEPTKPASAHPDNAPPLYPEEERRVNHSGVVLIKFIVTSNGKPEMSTVRVLHSSAPAFLKSVLVALPRLRFYPAERDGKPTRQLVVMPFAFTVLR